MWPLMLERPEHTRLRTLINKAITPAIVRGFIPTIQRLVGELLDDALAKGGMDAIADLAYPFPLNVVSEIIGAPAEGRALLKACAVDIVNFFGSPPHLYIEKAETAMRSIGETTDFLRDVLRMWRSQPKQDLISSLIAAEERGDVMSEEEILTTCLMIVFAGFETTTNLIGNGLLLLLQHPEEQRKLRQDPSLMKSAVVEMLRYESPVQRLSRMALANFDLCGCSIRRGDLMFLMVSSANRDAAQFDDPDRFDITRDTRKHLAFGDSIHLCPGNTLAQLEAQILFTELLGRVPRLTLLESEPDWQINLSVRSLNRLHVAFH
jgi:pimeloyl-[acyl-carrier protein] synthase